MKIKNIVILIVLLAFGLSACDEFIDTTPKDRVSDKLAWKDEKTATLYLNYFYKYLHDYGSFGEQQFKGSLTEGLTETLKYGGYAPGSRAGDANMYSFTPEQMSASGNLLNCWDNAYIGIRRINEYLEGQKKYSKLTENVNNKLGAQARFFRAYLYFQLAKRHGGVILYKDMNLQKDMPRSSEEDTWNFIAEDLDFAATHLPVIWDGDDKGRVSKGAAYAFKSRAMLYAKRWDEVRIAADNVINLNIYNLESQYVNACIGGNNESILEYNYLTAGPNHSFDKYYSTFGEIENQGGSAAPTQEMVESYETFDGKKIDWSPWHTLAGTTNRPPYDLLEPRFHASIIYNGAKWKSNTMENSVNGTFGRYMGYRDNPYSQGKTVTGYYLRKLMNERLTNMVSYNSTQPWVEIRLAEVYLNRAEAYYYLNNSGKAMDDMNVLRSRVGLPKKEGLSGQSLFDAIRQERKIELFVEGHLYWDMRRWKLAEKEYTGNRVHGMKISKNLAGWLYQYVDADLQDRKFLKKTYVLPVPYNELSNNSAIEQYDEWK